MGKVNKTLAEWQSELSPAEYQITRLKGTEPPYTGEYWQTMQQGIYVCRCCALPLFSSAHKFMSHCGWASFYQPIDEQCIVEYADTSYGMQRVEIVCQRCDAHLGHVFDDAPDMPTG
ncbi:MAG: peptide-methionine (R)-S-oxide reductase MsrB, partial [Acinetobacter sp.]|nr:peptide-methionine (R)-S-oxide reductase MsrB [Acinetobacter sp.]